MVLLKLKERAACKAEQIHKMRTIFTQRDNLGPFRVIIVHFVNLLSFTSSSFFLSLTKIHVIQLATA
jgi:hypothetical protein